MVFYAKSIFSFLLLLHVWDFEYPGGGGGGGDKTRNEEMRNGK